MSAPIANLDAKAGFSAPICSAVRPESSQKPNETAAKYFPISLAIPSAGYRVKP